MSTIDDFTRAYRNAMPEQFSGAVNLMAHPLAGMAAASALGLGLAGHAFGMWAGAVAGATQASQQLFAGFAEGQPKRAARPAPLRLVASQPAAKRKAETVAPAPVAQPETADDLKAISGIGPKLEKVLNRFGITTYAQLAALTEADIADLDAKLGLSGRIGRDDWVGQAAALASAGR
ncbi:MAG TPA: NADH-ubiquinone dehydrogenase [Aquamicrobium sp.]|nr:NADH-ubiquinone dehydrogenase [Aquamicrobium sp.]